PPPPRKKMIFSKRKTLKAPVIRTAPTSTTTVIPAKAGIQKHNATGIYRKNTHTPPPSFPRRRESRPVGTETYRIKQFP
ncbi:hypothetical protein, partial [Neisseria blantyrii]|uniref:hypothetical protein n=1 Tax=Neisseria blantyrii TaxID=2830647 RepID=UPI0026590738